MASPTGKQSVEALASTTSLEGKWKIIITVEFIPLPKEKEEAYWAAIKFFAHEMQKCVQEESLTDPAFVRTWRNHESKNLLCTCPHRHHHPLRNGDFMEIKLLTYTIVFLFTVWAVYMLMREWFESKNRLTNVEKKNEDLETRVSKLEANSRKRIPYESAESILDAMAALDALAAEENFKQTLIENARAHLTNSLSAGTKRETQ